ncbi:hypothetical protein HNP46_004266 [Pseudomonas nitritireducens]|uniref:Uncharacterized protein n=1 Tax=Pseudomonas nitroreducens TaxID=46680 RepID=A0A7W7P3B0_PSENT|nr:hypothetical protein [Pseudomonas nitritireducens]MBB4865385.1 hypothetical protein [Pseudomonas nitritireducens]
MGKITRIDYAVNIILKDMFAFDINVKRPEGIYEQLAPAVSPEGEILTYGPDSLVFAFATSLNNRLVRKLRKSTRNRALEDYSRSALLRYLTKIGVNPIDLMYVAYGEHTHNFIGSDVCVYWETLHPENTDGFAERVRSLDDMIEQWLALPTYAKPRFKDASSVMNAPGARLMSAIANTTESQAHFIYTSRHGVRLVKEWLDEISVCPQEFQLTAVKNLLCSSLLFDEDDLVEYRATAKPALKQIVQLCGKLDLSFGTDGDWHKQSVIQHLKEMGFDRQEQLEAITQLANTRWPMLISSACADLIWEPHVLVPHLLKAGLDEPAIRAVVKNCLATEVTAYVGSEETSDNLKLPVLKAVVEKLCSAFREHGLSPLEGSDVLDTLTVSLHLCEEFFPKGYIRADAEVPSFDRFCRAKIGDDTALGTKRDYLDQWVNMAHAMGRPDIIESLLAQHFRTGCKDDVLEGSYMLRAVLEHERTDIKSALRTPARRLRAIELGIRVDEAFEMSKEREQTKFMLSTMEI